MMYDEEKKHSSLLCIVTDLLMKERHMINEMAFNDRLSAIFSFEMSSIHTECPGKLSKFVQQKFMSHIMHSAETRYFLSSAVASVMCRGWTRAL